VHGGVLFSLGGYGGRLFADVCRGKSGYLVLPYQLFESCGNGRNKGESEARHRGQSTWDAACGLMQGEVSCEASFYLFRTGQVKKISLIRIGKKGTAKAVLFLLQREDDWQPVCHKKRPHLRSFLSATTTDLEGKSLLRENVGILPPEFRLKNIRDSSLRPKKPSRV